MSTTIADDVARRAQLGEKENLLANLPQSDGVCLMYIGGEFVKASDGGTRKLINPANGEVAAIVAEGTKEDAERAIRNARQAFDSGVWPDTPALDRAKLLFKLAILL